MPRSALIRGFGAIVKDQRGQLGLSQEALADRAGLHRTYVSDVERGVRNVSLECIGRLSAALEKSVAGLFAESARFLEGENGASPPAAGMVPARPVEILYVEDNPDDIALTLHALQSARLSNRIHVVTTGREALAYLIHRSARRDARAPRAPRLVLLDLMLPDLHGFEVLDRIRANEATRSLPVIVLTASRSSRDAEISRRLGAEAVIVKPVEFGKLRETAARFHLEWSLTEPPHPSSRS